MNGRRPRRNAFAVLGCAVLLAGCGANPAATAPTIASTSPSASGSSTSAPSPVTTSPAAAAAAPGLADGTYRLSADPQCGEFAMDGSSLVVRGGKATLTPGRWAGSDTLGQPASGTITTQGKNVRVHVTNGTAAIIDLTATIGAPGTLSGSGKSGGLHLSGETGWACEFTFTATSGPATGTTENVTTFYSPTRNISCQILPDSVYCQTRTPPRSVTLTADGTYKTCEGCLGDPGEHTPVLAYGNSTRVGAFTCVSESAGVTCTTAGKGFAISRSGIVKAP
ncbi:hypothetical protein M8542_34500 [Amycolatopsis sp. OK19-0408]|uniref:Lipoprotein n=1 Tax=Amycolatopsis iheyensis TaxID=2945988 RepID=A0A9X2NHI3_9PSEU|nr:hypothetical protein [Amycolatopsis iheyensis]MCR6487948.1 hypothetical protein [Amycolatopsis iheyensis]